MDRRSFIKSGAVFGGALFLARSIMPHHLKAATTGLNWFREIRALGNHLEQGHISQLRWQTDMATLFGRYSLEEVLGFVDFEALTRDLSYPDHWGAIRNIRPPKSLNMPPRGEKLFGYAKGRATAPHAHNHMTSAHLILQGSFHVRTWHRLRDEENALVLQPSLDRVMHAGEWVTMTDDSDNIHWFEATENASFTLNIPVTNIPHQKTYKVNANKYQMIYIDPTVKSDGKGLVHAPVISFQQAQSLFS